MACVMTLENTQNYTKAPLPELRLEYVKIAAPIDDLVTLIY